MISTHLPGPLSTVRRVAPSIEHGDVVYSSAFLHARQTKHHPVTPKTLTYSRSIHYPTLPLLATIILEQNLPHSSDFFNAQIRTISTPTTLPFHHLRCIMEDLDQFSDSQNDSQQENIPPENTPAEEMAPEGAPSEDALSEYGPSEHSPSEHMPSEDSLSDEMSSEGTLPEDTPSEDSLPDDTLSEDMLREHTLLEDMLSGGTPSRQSTPEETTPEDDPSGDTPHHWRAVVYQRHDGGWLLFHFHTSVPGPQRRHFLHFISTLIRRYATRPHNQDLTVLAPVPDHYPVPESIQAIVDESPLHYCLREMQRYLARTREHLHMNYSRPQIHSHRDYYYPVRRCDRLGADAPSSPGPVNYQAVPFTRGVLWHNDACTVTSFEVRCWRCGKEINRQTRRVVSYERCWNREGHYRPNHFHRSTRRWPALVDPNQCYDCVWEGSALGLPRHNETNNERNNDPDSDNETGEAPSLTQSVDDLDDFLIL